MNGGAGYTVVQVICQLLFLSVIKTWGGGGGGFICSAGYSPKNMVHIYYSPLKTISYWEVCYVRNAMWALIAAKWSETAKHTPVIIKSFCPSMYADLCPDPLTQTGLWVYLTSPVQGFVGIFGVLF